MGVGQLSAADPEVGLPQLAKLIAVENVVYIAHDGRSTGLLAQSWYIAPDGRSLRLRLRPHVTFHDGTPVTSAIVAQIVQAQLLRALGPALQHTAGTRAISENEVEIEQERLSPFLVESLDFPIQKPGGAGIGTGPFSIERGPSSIEMRANDAYYLGAPTIRRIVLRSYPTVRAAWADLLRGQVDMLYDVGLDALDSLQASSKVSVYTYPRSYAYVILLNTRRPALASREVRRALGQAIDRGQLIREALSNHGTPAEGPVWPQHWAYNQTFPTYRFDPSGASKTLKGRLHFKCIFADGAPFERLALAVQKQLAAVGVDMEVESVSIDEVVDRVTKRADFDAVLFDAQLAPNIFRPYQFWRSGAPRNYGKFSSARVDAALDAVRYAADDRTYAAAALEFQRAMIDDPPAVYLAWGERAQAVTHRFVVTAEPGRSLVSALRLMKPATESPASRN